MKLQVQTRRPVYMDRRRMIVGATVASLAGCSESSASRPLTVVSYGAGTYQESHKRAFLTPFTQATGKDTQSLTWGAEYGRLRAMVEAGGDVPWDVVDVTAAILARGKRDGILAPIAPLPDARSFLPGTVDQYGVGNVYWATVLAYDSTSPGPAPREWRDFFDIGGFPGPRALYDDPRGNIEFALLASGLSKGEIYPLTPEKIKIAFQRLNSIRDSIRVWWSDGSQPVQLLLTRQVRYSSAWSGRIFASEQASAKIRYPWNGAALELDYWVIPKGSKNTKTAAEFIGFASAPERLAAQAKLIAYGPANQAALNALPSPLLTQLPTYGPNFDSSFVVDASEWEKHEDELRARWLSWKTTGSA